MSSPSRVALSLSAFLLLGPGCDPQTVDEDATTGDSGLDARSDAADGGPSPVDTGSPDADVDGGLPDAGLPDSGDLDGGGMDAGESDGGMPDTGMPDTGMPDAGMPDAGMPDTGMPDTGMPDTGMPDTGIPDAGMPDAGCTTRTCYRDSDGDTFYGGFSVCGACPSGSLMTNPGMSDCADFDANVRPNQTAFFTSGYASGAGTSFDYDCDGLTERRFPRSRDGAECTSATTFDACGLLSGWEESGPISCGAVRDYYACAWTGSACVVGPSTGPLQQSCQ